MKETNIGIGMVQQMGRSIIGEGKNNNTNFSKTSKVAIAGLTVCVALSMAFSSLKEVILGPTEKELRDIRSNNSFQNPNQPRRGFGR